MLINWPERLVNQLARRRAVLFLGSGTSAGSVSASGKHPPTWLNFLQEGVKRSPHSERIAKRLLKKGKLLEACDLLKESLGAIWDELLEETFINPGFEPSPVHRPILDLDQRVTLTQNFDTIYETFASSELNGTIEIKSYHDTDIARFASFEGRTIVKAHGTVSCRAEMIFTQHDYFKARAKFPYFYNILDALAITSTFVFIGCGMDDPDVQLMLSNHRFRHPHGKPHYFVIRKGDMEDQLKNHYARVYNLQFLEYTRSEDHAHLVVDLRSLVTEVDNRRDKLLANQDW